LSFFGGHGNDEIKDEAEKIKRFFLQE